MHSYNSIQIPPEFLIAITEIVAAQAVKLQQEHTIKRLCRNAKARLDSARRDYNQFGLYDDCGPSYEDDLRRAEGAMNLHKRLVPELISSQKYLKKLKAQFKEKYGQEGQDLLNVVLADRQKKLDQYHRAAGLAKKNAAKEAQRELSRQQNQANIYE